MVPHWISRSASDESSRADAESDWWHRPKLFILAAQRYQGTTGKLEVPWLGGVPARVQSGLRSPPPQQTACLPESPHPPTCYPSSCRRRALGEKEGAKD